MAEKVDQNPVAKFRMNGVTTYLYEYRCDCGKSFEAAEHGKHQCSNCLIKVYQTPEFKQQLLEEFPNDTDEELPLITSPADYEWTTFRELEN